MRDRYSRQELFLPIGTDGQKKIRRKHAVIVGMGALGSSIADMLARAGIGKLTILDRDYVDWSNLGRQILYEESDAVNHMPKAVAAKEKLYRINQEVEVEAHVMNVTGKDLESLVNRDVDLILDGTDQFEVRLMINDVAHKYKIPWIYGACVGSYGMSYTIIPDETPCLHCLLQSAPLQGPTCDTAGVISPIVHLITAHQTAEALKFLVDGKESLRRELISFDLWNYKHQSIQVDHLKRASCPSCGENPTYPFIQDSAIQTDVLCGRDTVQIRPVHKETRDLDQLQHLLEQKAGKTVRNDYLIMHQSDHRFVFFKDGRVLVHGTKDIRRAAELYRGLIAR